MEFLKKMMGKDETSMVDSGDKNMKMDALKKMSDEASAGMADGMKKVTVSADSPEGLKMGLEKAEEVVDGKMLDPKMLEELLMSEDEEIQMLIDAMLEKRAMMRGK